MVVLAVVALAACDARRDASPAPAATRVPADLLIRDAAVYTLDAAQPWAEAVTVRDGVIRHVGSLEAALVEVGPDTEIISAPGGLVLPGFQDAHVHPYIAGLDFFDCDMLETDPMPEAYAARARECYEQMSERTWITGAGWNPTAFGAEPRPERALLDAAVPDKPAVFFSNDGHTAWVNSLALAAAGIDRETPDPPNGRIDRDPGTGEPSGSLQEAAMLAMRALLPPPPPAQREAAMVYMRDYLHSLGITAIQVAYASIDDDDPVQALATYRDFADRGLLRLHTVISLLWDQERGLEQIDELIAARARVSGGLVQANTVKLFLDGVVEPHTAALIDDYSDRPGYRGELQIEPRTLQDAVARLDAEGFQVHIHVIGDRAVRAALDAFAHARRVNGVTDGRHHLAHVQFIHPDDRARFAELNVTATFSPIWAGGEDEFLTVLTLPRVGPDRYKWTYTLRSILDAGGRVAFGSDWNVTSPDPLLAIESAVTRRNALDPSLPAFLPEEAITLEEALVAATQAAAYVNHLDGSTGMLVVGKQADIVVLNDNLFDLPADAISDAAVAVTIFGGEVVYRAPSP